MCGQQVATNVEIVVHGETYTVDAVLDPSGEIDYYDVYDSLGSCINLGQPFWEMPTAETIRPHIESTLSE